ARAKTAQAQAQVQQAIGSMNVLDPTSEISRYEDQIRRQEALVAGQAEVNASSLDSQFAELEADADSLEVDARFAALKSGGAAGQIGTTPQGLDQRRPAPRRADEPSRGRCGIE